FDDSGQPRPVRVVDAGVRRQTDIRVVSACDDMRHPEDGSVWTSICRTLLEMVSSHSSTIIFANTRRVVERLTMGINELAGEELVQPHHGSVSAPLRRRTEQALKNGTLKGVVATGTLELGIDSGAVDLVCQVESPKEISRGLQRVGRAGHTYKATSVGRIIPKSSTDLAESVAVAAGMLEGDVEPMSVPRNCLDVLAQQIVAMAALEPTTIDDVYRTVRRTYPFHELSEEAFNLTLQLVSGRYPSKLFRDLRPRVSLDRVTGRISPLPGSQKLVIANGGAIPDTGEYGVYLAEANLKLGELDEEFVYESREGDTFSLGTHNWKIVKIEADRVVVEHGSPHQARMPFWRGESVSRSARTGRRMGEVLRTIAEKGESAYKWAVQSLPVDERAARGLCDLVSAQVGTAGESGLPTDRRIVLETFPDEVGALRLALLSVFGGRIHHALRIALTALIKRELGMEPESVCGDNGVLIRLPDGDAPAPRDLIRRLT
ncbi:MAG: helicase-related protein, partial [Armatimonadota bacterium]